MTDLFFIVCVVLFWIVAAIFAMWFTARVLRTPTESEIELAAQTAHASHADGDAHSAKASKTSRA